MKGRGAITGWLALNLRPAGNTVNTYLFGKFLSALYRKMTKQSKNGWTEVKRRRQVDTSLLV